MLNRILIWVLLLLNTSLLAQKLDAVRLEVPSNIDAETFHMEAIGKDGFLIFYESNELDSEKNRKWYFGLFDTDLKQQWLKFVPLADKIEFITSKREKNNIYILYKNLSRDRADFGYYEIINYDTRRQDFSKISGSIPAKAEFAGFEIIENTACLALNLKKKETDLVFINLNNGDLEPVHIDLGTQGFIEAVYADLGNKLFYVAIKQSNDRRYISDHLMAYSLDGTQKHNLKVGNTEPLKYFKDYTFINTNKSELLVFGTYNMITGRSLSFKDLEEDTENKSAGMFFLKFVNHKQEKLRYYDFMGFNNISGAIGPDNFVTTKQPDNSDTTKKANRMVTASFNLSNPEVYKSHDGVFIFSVEVFQPYYKTETRMDYDFYGRPYPYTYNVFSGYDFYDVIVAGLYDDGTLVWSNDFPIEDMLTFSRSRKSLVFSDENYVSLAYVNNGKVVSQTIEGPADIERTKAKIGSDYPQDKVSQEENSHIIHWYEDYYLIYGYQKIKNRTLGDQSTRTVFYANKIAYK